MEFDVFNGRLRYQRPEELDIDYSDGDQFLCAISSGVDLILLRLPDVAVHIGALVAVSLHTGDDDPVTGELHSMFNLEQPVPGTELLARVELVRARVERQKLELLGMLTLDQDNVHTFVYATVASSNPLSPAAVSPVRGAVVEVMDQDRPAPPGDDIDIPEEGSVTRTHGKVETTTTTEYLPPTGDQRLARAATDARARSASCSAAAAAVATSR